MKFVKREEGKTKRNSAIETEKEMFKDKQYLLHNKIRLKLLVLTDMWYRSFVLFTRTYLRTDF